MSGMLVEIELHGQSQVKKFGHADHTIVYDALSPSERIEFPRLGKGDKPTCTSLINIPVCFYDAERTSV
jgi:hypothetical protein